MKLNLAKLRERHLTFRQRLTLSLLAVGLASLLLAGFVYVVNDLWTYRQLGTQRLAIHADQIEQRVQRAGSFEELVADDTWSLGVSADAFVGAVYLLDASGNTITSFANQGFEGRSTPPDKSENLLDVIYRHGVFVDGDKVGTVVITADPSRFVFRATSDGAILFALVGVSILLTLGLSRRIHRRFSDQILDLAHAANAISVRKDYSIRAMRRSNDEIGLLADAFNHMITQIELRDLQLKSEVERAEAAKVAKAQFLATMSHEIRTPINGILGMTELLLDTSLEGEQVEFARTVHTSADGLLTVINDILDFSKGEADRYDIETISFSISSVAKECLDTVGIAAAEKGLELCCHIDGDVPPRLLGDPSRLRQVLLNLLSNALKFTSEGEVVLKIMQVTKREEGVELRLEVQDSGIGIPEDRIERLFQPFTQADASNNRRFGGTGLGLAISKQIVEAMGGTLYVRSKEGEGSTFGMNMILQVDTSAEVPVVTGPSGLRILVADPNETSRKSLVDALGGENEVVAVADGFTARHYLYNSTEEGEAPFELVILDLRLAEGFGLGQDHQEDEVSGPPLLLLCPLSHLSTAAAARWNGRTASLAKPFQREDLYWCLEELFSRAVRPSAAGRGGPAPGSTTGDDDLQHVRVLVAEDHPVNQKITTRFLDKLGCSWELAENGEQAVAMLREAHFDLILMDVQMPVMDGLEATIAIRRLEAMTGDHVPITALTANVLEEDRMECQRAGFDDYLAKPVKFEQLRTHLLRWVREGRTTAA